MTEIRIQHSIGETFSTNSNSFQYTVALQLIQNQIRVDNSGLFQFVRDNATNEMRMSLVQHVHQIVQRLTINHRDSLEGR